MKRSFYDYKYACKKMGFKNLLIVEEEGPWNLDCMSKKLSLTDFCDKELVETSDLLYGKIDKIEHKVSCVRGDSVRVVLLCDSAYSKYCQDKKIGCSSLKSHYANNLESIHQSISSNDQGQVLNCYFAKKIIDDGLKLEL